MAVTMKNNPDGTMDFLDNQNRVIATVDPANRKIILPSGAIIDTTASTAGLSLAAGTILTAMLAANAVTSAKLTTTLATGHIPLPFAFARKIVTNAIPNLAAHGGILASDSDPILERVNGATDKALRIRWAATSIVELQWQIALPADLNTAQPLVVKARAFMAGATDTPVLTVGYWPGVGGTNGGGNTGALSNAEQTVSRSIVAPGATEASITLTPGAHGTDDLYLVDLWCEYTRQ